MNKIGHKHRFKLGDIYCEKYNDHYFFGRIILDIKKVIKIYGDTLYNQNNSTLFSDMYFIEMYDYIGTEPELKTDNVAFVDTIEARSFHNERDYDDEYGQGWFNYGNKPIDLKTLEFPEFVEGSHQRDTYKFIRGAIELDTNIPIENMNEPQNEGNIRFGLNLYPFYLIEMLLDFNDRRDLIYKYSELPPTNAYLSEKQFLHLNPKRRNQIYHAMGENPDMSYYDFAKKHGHDLNAFYEKLID